jgi:hypothetical protein
VQWKIFPLAFENLTDEERATCSSSKMVQLPIQHAIQWLPTECFGDQIISLLCQACSSNLTPCDYYLWGNLKDNAYESNTNKHTHTHTHRTNLKKSSGVQHQQFLDKNFKQYLIICSPGVKHVWELKEVISNTYSNMQVVIYILHEEM